MLSVAGASLLASQLPAATRLWSLGGTSNRSESVQLTKSDKMYFESYEEYRRRRP